MSSASTFQEIAAALHGAQRIAVACHVRPDGDAISSVGALARSLELAGKTVFPISEDGVPANLRFLPGADRVTVPDGAALDVDVAVAVDTSTRERLGGRTLQSFAAARVLINIDHHHTNPCYGDLNYIDPSSPAAAQIIYEFLASQGFPIDDAVRQNAYTGISTDTGSFQYANTSSRTLRIVAEMLDAGLDASALCRQLYEAVPLRRLHLQRSLLNEMRISEDGRVASWALTLATLQSVGAQPGDTEDLAEILRSIEGVVASVIFEEIPGGKVRISSRSKDSRVDVSRVCAEFGGGGHPMAAGARMSGPIGEAEVRFLQSLKNEIKRIG